LRPILNIKDLIPQKKPFVMVDDLRNHTKDEVISSLEIRETNLFFDDDVLLEPGLIENMAQTIALHTGYSYFLKGVEPPTGYIGAIKNVDIVRLPTLHETILTKAIILQEFMGVTLVEIEIFDQSNQIIASCQMKTVITD
jgi:3-hydroxyacyl-[acyl-carrier-protein] dehydratase